MSEWSKEDKIVFNRSEVMVEFEKRIINAANALSQKIQKISQETNIDDTKRKVDELNKSIQKAKEGLDAMNMTDDHLINNLDADLVEGNQAGLAEEDLLEEAVEAEKVIEREEAEDQLLEEMQALAEMAISEGNYKVAYQIERTISEIIDGE